MPIKENEFSKSSLDPSTLLMDFLSANYRNAYSLGELVEVMTAAGKNLAAEDIERLLSALEYGGKVDSKTIDGKTYYRYSKVMGNRLI
jgi:hypothetical protein